MSNQANATEALRRFVEAINRRDVEALTRLMHPDHLFVDSLGNRVEGAARMQLGWRAYFTMCPDYWIRINDVVSEGAIALATGEAGGTIDNVAWRTPAAWKAVTANDMMLEWHVFADNKPVWEILARRKPS